MPDFHTIPDVLEFAISLEQSSQEFYRRLSHTVENPAISKYLLTLVEQEKLHEQRLRSLLDGQEGDLFADPISMQEIQAYVQAVKVPASLSYKQAVKIALDKEKAAQMLYSIIAGIMEDPALKEIFLLLSDQERIHREFFENQFNQLQISEN